jgi:T-complex protein 1 subunit delta
LGTADLIDEEGLADGGKVLKITGVKKDARTLSLFLRASNQLVLDECDRSIHDALCVVRALIKNRSIIPGGGAVEIEIAQKLDAYAATIQGIDSIILSAYAASLEVIPSTLAENCGLNPILTVTELRNRHKKGEMRAALDAKNGVIIENGISANIMQPTLVTESALTLATEVVRMILKIDDLVLTR